VLISSAAVCVIPIAARQGFQAAGSNAAKTDRQHRLQKLLPLARLKSFTTTLVALLLT
jgi:hypothetical protein